MSDHKQYCSRMYCNMDNETVDIMMENETRPLDELLIHHVRGYPHLYNHEHKDFKDKLLKENSWREISSIIKMSVLDCQTQWIRLREKFGKEKRQRELEVRSGSGTSRRAAFPLYASMLFLEKHIKRRQSYTNVSNFKHRKNAHTVIEKDVAIESLESSASCSNADTPSMQINDDTNVSSYTLHDTGSTTPEQVSSHMLGSTTFQSPSPTHCFNAIESEDSSDTYDSLGSRSTSSLSSGTQSNRSILKNRNKRIDMTQMQESFVCLTQAMHNRLTNASNSEIKTSTADQSFAKLIVSELELLPEDEKRRRKQAILQILYEPYNS